MNLPVGSEMVGAQVNCAALAARCLDRLQPRLIELGLLLEFGIARFELLYPGLQRIQAVEDGVARRHWRGSGMVGTRHPPAPGSRSEFALRLASWKRPHLVGRRQACVTASAEAPARSRMRISDLPLNLVGAAAQRFASSKIWSNRAPSLK